MNDIKEGLIPTFFIANIGSTSTLCIDEIEVIKKVCEKYNIWLHVDSAHLGIYSALEEWSHLFKGFEYSDSFNINGHKSLGTGSGVAFCWTKHDDYFSLISPDQDSNDFERNFVSDHVDSRALRVWLVLSLYGKEVI